MSDSEKTSALAHLAGAVAHELNNIFTAVAGNLAFLESAFDKNDDNARLIEDVLRTTHRGMELSRKLQAFAGRQAMQRRRIDLNREVIHIVSQLKASILRQVDVQLELAKGECAVQLDEDKLHRVLEELCKNAAAAMDHRGTLGISTAIVLLKNHEIGQLMAGSYVKLTLRDRGVGMDPDVAARAIEPFFTTKPGNAETGWGLSKAFGFVRQSGGRLVLSSAAKLGTVVEIYLPESPAGQNPTPTRMLAS